MLTFEEFLLQDHDTAEVIRCEDCDVTLDGVSLTGLCPRCERLERLRLEDEAAQGDGYSADDDLEG